MDDSTRQKIEKRAYELFLARNGVHGYHLEDWVKAEREIAGTAKQLRVEREPRKAQNIRAR
jgi:hypothetical protein